MKKINTTILLLILALTGISQTKGVKPIVTAETLNTGITRAVVVGISDYQNEKITDLQYAHKDAKIFADYLIDPNGLNLDPAHVTLLQNEQATSGQFVSALYAMLEESQEGDLNIIYFSGHGDVESTTINQPGFLLCWDAPSRVYMSGGTFGLAYLQEIISTLSLQTHSRVVMISDACRAGKLAGTKIGGSQATAANLSKQYANEVKILSCQPDEFALEGESWGGGRGVFSFYLMAGLRGLADKNEDGQVTLSEIQRYLEDNVSESVAPHSQIPMIVGSRNTVLTDVNPIALAQAKEEVEQSSFKPSDSRAVGINKEMFHDTSRYESYLEFTNALTKGHLLFPYEGSAYAIFDEIKEYEELARYVNMMRRNLSAALQDEAQQAINRYLAGDSEELRLRWKFDDTYGRYPEILNKAANLLGEKHFFYETLKARSYYFKGLNYRLKGDASKNDSLLHLALNLQDSCLLLEPNAAHALNEKGYTSLLLKKYDDAITYYNQTLKITPSWALVYANLAGCYNDINDYERGIEYGKKAITMDSTLLFGYYNLGEGYIKSGVTDSAFYVYDQALTLDSLYYPIYTKLAWINFEKGDYARSYEYGKKAFEIFPNDLTNLINLAHTCLKYQKQDEAKVYFDYALQAYPTSIEAIQGRIEYFFYTGDLENAEIELVRYLEIKPDDNFAYYLVASINAGNSKTENSMLYLEKAMEKGFRDFKTIENDANFSELIKTEHYKDLVAKYKN